TRREMTEQIGVHAHPGVNTYGPIVSRGIDSGVFERFPGTFEEDTLLRIEYLRLAWLNVKKTGVEHVRALEEGPNIHRVSIIRISAVCVCGLGDAGNGVDAVTKVFPILIKVGRLGKSSCHAHDGYGVRVGIAVCHAETSSRSWSNIALWRRARDRMRSNDEPPFVEAPRCPAREATV